LFDEGLTLSSPTLPRWGLMLGGELWELSMSERAHRRERIWIAASHISNAEHDGRDGDGANEHQRKRPEVGRGQLIGRDGCNGDMADTKNDGIGRRQQQSKGSEGSGDVADVSQNQTLAHPNGARTEGVCGTIGINRRRDVGRDESSFRQTHRQGGADRLGTTSETSGDVADADGSESGESAKSQRLERKDSGRGSSDCRGTAGTWANVADAEEQGLEGSEPARDPRSGGRSAEHRSWRRQTDWWETEPDVGRVVDGMAARVDRLRCIGNGQVPAVAAIAWEMLTQADEG